MEIENLKSEILNCNLQGADGRSAIFYPPREA